ncbi:MAG: DUF58 domain-containing protein [Bacteroidota bacterium]|nr:DUF58 domain-containing protein [Bacteroidota bacterium]MEC7247407.1 DUF58 domain-containing protein [Bacteroidota bacterium]MEC7549291.1 DUF58 domain-containing protein [Bacteroidota bacterium]MEC7829349.1 DUF58 domain-containing protein [Bacteroidota bacterium]MEC8097541.1 DUF58 domain-containing protein [Bacteroidota bacterium]|tara:strand:+ start:11181 stop:12047 length:867 start_codon:yes stop_codon:yes gene_type:complete
MNTKELLKKVRKIEIKTRKLSNNIFGGEYHSAFKGRGMTFSEVRKYQYGDDVRTIDWNVTARYREPYVKVFEEERELTLMLLVDISGSSNFGTRTKLKNEILTEIAATLAFSALNNNDKVGLVLFSNKIELFIAPKKGKIHILRIIRELLNYESTSLKTNISKALEFLSQVQKKKAIIFILSDFIDSDYSKSVQLLSKKHDLTGVRIFDLFEKELQKSGLLFVNDAETGRKLWINSSSKKVRESYNLSFRKNADYFKNTFSKNGAGAIALSTNDEYVKTLLNYFKNRA